MPALELANLIAFLLVGHEGVDVIGVKSVPEAEGPLFARGLVVETGSSRLAITVEEL